MRHTLLLIAAALSVATAVQAQDAAGTAAAPGDDGADLAKKLSNPVADLISVPFQFNYNGGFPQGDGEQYY